MSSPNGASLEERSWSDWLVDARRSLDLFERKDAARIVNFRGAYLLILFERRPRSVEHVGPDFTENNRVFDSPCAH